MILSEMVNQDPHLDPALKKAQTVSKDLGSGAPILWLQLPHAKLSEQLVLGVVCAPLRRFLDIVFPKIRTCNGSMITPFCTGSS